MFVLLFVIFTSFWFWKITNTDLLVGGIVFLLTVLLYRAVVLNKKGTKTFVFITFLSLTIALLQFRGGLYKEIFSFNLTERIIFNTYHHYLANDLKYLYKNKIGTYLYSNFWFQFKKYNENLFSNLDPNLYFFSSHPLERVNVREFNKYHPLTLPFFLIGLFWIITKGTYLTFLYIVLFTTISGFVKPNYLLGPILFFPIVSVIISVGLKTIISILEMQNLKDE